MGRPFLWAGVDYESIFKNEKLINFKIFLLPPNSFTIRVKLVPERMIWKSNVSCFLVFSKTFCCSELSLCNLSKYLCLVYDTVESMKYLQELEKGGNSPRLSKAFLNCIFKTKLCFWTVSSLFLK